MGGCSDNHGIQTDTAYAPGLGLRGLGTTYDWAGDTRVATGSSTTAQALTPEICDFIETDVARELAARGFRRAARGQMPDFLLAYKVTKQTRATTIQKYPYSEEFEEGAFVLDAMDPSTRKVVWRGVARGKVREDLTPGERKTRVQYGLSQLLSKFPTPTGQPPAAKK